MHHHPLSTKNLISDLENYNPLGVHQRGGNNNQITTAGAIKSTNAKGGHNSHNNNEYGNNNENVNMNQENNNSRTR